MASEVTEISGMGTTFNLPNYHGELFTITPKETPLLSAIGGLTGGMMATSTEFEWQTEGLRQSGQRTALEGADAPGAGEQARSKVRNVAQIHHETVSVSYTKQSTPGMVSTPSSAPYTTDNGSNPVTNELDHQVAIKLAEIALDVNFSFWNGHYVLPTDNSTARQTRGIIEAITTNSLSLAAHLGTGLTSATDTISETTTPVANGNKVVFTKVGTSSLKPGRTYFVVAKATDSFKVAKTLGGTAITLGTQSGLEYILPSTTALTVDDIDAFVQTIFDNGGLTGGEATLGVNSSIKRAITSAYATAYGKQTDLIQGTIGGVTVDRIETNFGVLNLLLDRDIPQDAMVALTLSELAPVFLSVPGKGVFFEEPLAKTGSSDEVQLYGEIGLKYGAESHHGLLRGIHIP